MALHEIRTLITRDRTSRIAFGDFENDLTAISAARQLLRRRETVEVWRGDDLIFRTGPVNHTGRMQLEIQTILAMVCTAIGVDGFEIMLDHRQNRSAIRSNTTAPNRPPMKTIFCQD